MKKELLKLFFKQFGRKPKDQLEWLQWRFKTSQQSGKGQILRPDFGKKKPWYKGEGEVIDTSFRNDKKVNMSNEDYSILKDEWFTKIIANTDDALNTFLKRGIDKADKRFSNLTQNQRKDFLNMVEYRLKHGNKKFMNDFTDAKGEFKLPEDLAGGGLAGMLGEPTYADENHRVPLSGGGGLKAALEIIMKKFGKDAITTTSKIKRPTKAIEAESTKEAFDRLTNKINTQEALARGTKKMAGWVKNKNKKSYLDPESTDATTWLQQEEFFDPKALDVYGKKVPSNWIEVEKKAAQKLIDDLGPLDVSPNHPNYKDMKAIRQSAKDRLESIKITEALGGNIKMHDWIRMKRKNIKMSDYIKKEGAPVVKDELSGIKKAFIQKKTSPWYTDPKTLTPEDELRKEFPGISDDLIKNILADDNPQRIAEVKATMHEAMKMQDKGMGVDEIVNIFKDMKRTKNSSGGRVPRSGGGIMKLLKLFKTEPFSVKEFLKRRQFLKNLVGNTPENEKKRILQEILEENKKVKGFEFSDVGPESNIHKEIETILSKDITKHADGGLAGMLGE